MAEKTGFRTVHYRPGDIAHVNGARDPLPSPDELAGVEDNVKVTIGLTRRSIAFFKREAKQRRVPYQRMIRMLVDAYASRRSGSGR